MQSSSHGLIRRCLGELNSQRAEFSAQFYQAFFAELPQTRPLFSADRKRQELALYAVVSMVLRGLETGRSMDGDLLEFGRRHARMGVQPDFFPVFGEVFLRTLIAFLPQADSEQLAKAWCEAYGQISEIMVAGIRIEHSKRQLDRRVFRTPEKLPCR